MNLLLFGLMVAKYQAALQSMYLSTHRSLKLLVLFKKASACRGQRLTQELTAVQSAENKFLWSAQSWWNIWTERPAPFITEEWAGGENRSRASAFSRPSDRPDIGTFPLPQTNRAYPPWWTLKENFLSQLVSSKTRSCFWGWARNKDVRMLQEWSPNPYNSSLSSWLSLNKSTSGLRVFIYKMKRLQLTDTQVSIHFSIKVWSLNTITVTRLIPW